MYANRIRLRSGRRRLFHDHPGPVRRRRRGAARARRRVSRFCRLPAPAVHPRGGISGRPGVRPAANPCRPRCPRPPAPCGKVPGPGRGDAARAPVRPSRRTASAPPTRPACRSDRHQAARLLALTAGCAPRTVARPYIPRSRSTDFGAGSIDFSAAESRPGPCERPRQCPLLPESRPPRWRPALGSGRFPSRSRPVL